jgi:lipopolysaccharide export system permease protein
MSLLDRYTTREIFSHLLGISAVVLGIFILRRFGLLLDEAADGSLPFLVVLHLLALRTLVALPSLAPAALYFAVLIALGRLHQDHEMRALEACGVAPGRLARPVLRLAAVASIVIGLLSCWARPLAGARFDAVKSEALAGVGLDRMLPGRFYELGGSGHVLFSDRRAADDARALEGVFVERRDPADPQGLIVLTARRAVDQREPHTDWRFLHLLDGYQYDIDDEGRVREITQYEQMTLRTPVAPPHPEEREERARSMTALWSSGDRRDTAELQWRLAMPASAFLLVLAALPLGRVDPRHGRHGRLVAAMAIYVVYRQLLAAVQSAIEHGSVSPFPGLWAVHAAFLLLAVALHVQADGRALAWRARPSTA